MNITVVGYSAIYILVLLSVLYSVPVGGKITIVFFTYNKTAGASSDGA